MLVMETPSADVLVSNMSWPRFIVSGNRVSFQRQHDEDLPYRIASDYYVARVVGSEA
jgi:hypothetical protein